MTDARMSSEGEATAPQTLELETRDGFRLLADLHDCPAPHRAALIAPAMGVHRRFYRAFARYLNAAGIAVLTPDYRGMGDSRPRSLRGFRARLRDWAELDLEAAMALLRERYPTLPHVYIGHSVGGQLFGLLRPDTVARVERALFVASQSGYWGHWPWPERARMVALWYAIMPALTRSVGYLPLGRLQGRGQDVPAGVALEWIGWAKQRDYVMAYARTQPENGFAHFAGPLRSYAISDDPLAPRAAVAELLRFYRAARGELRQVTPRELGTSFIGHFAAFTPRFEPTLWPELLAFLAHEQTSSRAA